MVPSAAAWRYLHRARYNAFSMGKKFCLWWPWPLTLTFKLVRARDQTRLHCEIQIRSAIREIFDKQTNEKFSYCQRQKQNLTQFAACGNKILQFLTGVPAESVDGAGYWSQHIKGPTPLPWEVRWWMKTGWSQATGWDHCFVSLSALTRLMDNENRGDWLTRVHVANDN